MVLQLVAAKSYNFAATCSRRRNNGSAFSRKARKCQGRSRFYRFGVGVALLGFPGNVAHPIGHFFAAACSVFRCSWCLVLAARKARRAFHANVEVIGVVVIGTHLCQPRTVPL